MSHITEVELDPGMWYRGSADGSRLLRSDGRRCCIGIACHAAGVPDELLTERGVLHQEHVPLLPSWGRLLFDRSSEVAVYVLNDLGDLGDIQRVEAINADLEKTDIPLRFRLKDATKG